MRKLKLEELNRLSIEDFKASKKTPFIVVLDNIRSAFNVGSIFRTCDALAIEKLVLTGITAKPPHKEITKSAIGATESVHWSYQENIVDYIHELRQEGFEIIGVEQTNDSVSLSDFNFQEKNYEKKVIIFGNEVEGLNADLLPLLDSCIEIPQYGTKHSFNVAVCAGIVLWELLSRLKGGK